MHAEQAGPDDRTTWRRLRIVILGMVGVMVALIITSTVISSMV